MCCTHDVKEVEDFVRVLLKYINKRKSQNQSAHFKKDFRESFRGSKRLTLFTATLGSSQGKCKVNKKSIIPRVQVQP